MTKQKQKSIRKELLDARARHAGAAFQNDQLKNTKTQLENKIATLTEKLKIIDAALENLQEMIRKL